MNNDIFNLDSKVSTYSQLDTQPAGIVTTVKTLWTKPIVCTPFCPTKTCNVTPLCHI